MPRLSETTRQARRSQILTAAAECFAERGFTATSMSEIIRASGLSAGSIYSHFTSKEEILQEVASQNFARVRQTLSGLAAASTAPLTPRAIARALAEHLTVEGLRGRMFLRLEVEALTQEALAEQVRQNLERATQIVTEGLMEWVQAGEGGGEDPRPLARRWAMSTMAVVHGFMVRTSIEEQTDASQLLADLTALLPGS